MEATLSYIESHYAEALDGLKRFLRIPSISTQASHRGDIQAAAEWLRDEALQAGFPVARVMQTTGHPIVYGEWLAAGPQAPTVLIYGHYDVQPPDPTELWESPPFEPTERDGVLVARGASDDKGQTWVHLMTARAFGATLGAPPVNLKLIVEGEEEIGSPSFDPFVSAHRDLLAADVALIYDTHVLGKDLPALMVALRGLAYIEVEVTGPDHDLHSGIFGGAVRNPINALCAMLASLQDETGRILVDGFYDRVRPLSPEEREEFCRIPFDRSTWLQEAGVSTDWGEAEYSILERTSARPTLDINGIWGGYTQPGAKTVLPSKAFAKLSTRLVPDQNHKEITRLMEAQLQKIAPPSVTVQVRDLHGGEPASVRQDSVAMRAAVRAYAEAFGTTPVFMREGGSIPVVTTFQRYLGIDTILMGFGLPDDRLHSPNEKLDLLMFRRGMETSARFMAYLREAFLDCVEGQAGADTA